MRNVTLILDDGSRFHGKSFGYEKPVAGEVVFNTAMTGYPESLTDPSYAGQLMTLTYPLVGNYGVPPFTFESNGLATFMESERIHAEAIIVSDYSEEYSHWNAVESLADWLKREQVPGITGIDTRELTKVLREHGVMMGKIVFDSEQLTVDSGQLTVDSGQLTVDSGQLTVESGQLRVDSEQLTVKEEPLVCSTVAQPTVNCQLSTVNSLTVNSLNFKALAAFTEYEPEATRSIISSFIEETEKNIGRMEKALDDEDMAGIAGMSHKLLPLLTLIGAGNILPLLSWLEARRDDNISDEVKQETEAVLPLLRLVVEEARKYLLNS